MKFTYQLRPATDMQSDIHQGSDQSLFIPAYHTTTAIVTNIPAKNVSITCNPSGRFLFFGEEIGSDQR